MYPTITITITITIMYVVSINQYLFFLLVAMCHQNQDSGFGNPYLILILYISPTCQKKYLLVGPTNKALTYIIQIILL